MTRWNEWAEDPDLFARNIDSSQGRGSAQAANKGKVKRWLKGNRVPHKKHGKKAK